MFSTGVSLVLFSELPGRLEMRLSSGRRLNRQRWVIIFTVAVTSACAALANPQGTESTLVDTEFPTESYSTENFLGTTTLQDDFEDDKPVNFTGAQVIAALLTNKEQIKLIQDLADDQKIDIWLDSKGKRARFDFLVMPSYKQIVMEQLKELNITYKIIIKNLQAHIDLENPAQNLSEEDLARADYKLNWDGYFKFGTIFEFLDFYKTTYSDICTLEKIGNTIENRAVQMLRISSGGSKKRPAIFIEGGAHAREWISPATVTYVIKELVENRSSYASFVDDIDFHVVPLLNVDGYEYTHARNRMWRKNRRIIPGLCNGVDLNRNFGYKWGQAGGNRLNPCVENYSGKGAFSEPESTAIKDYILKFTPGYFQGYLSFHSYSQVIIYPWGYTTAMTPDSEDLKKVASNAAKAIKTDGGVNYRFGQTSRLLYSASGNSPDWAKAVAEIKYAYTIELPDRGFYGFSLPARFIKPTGRDAMKIIQAVAEEILLGQK